MKISVCSPAPCSAWGALLAASLLLASPAAATTLDFEGIGHFAGVGSFYDGGTGLGGVRGPDYGVVFAGNGVGIVDAAAEGGEYFANEPSPSTVMTIAGHQSATVMTVEGGFDAASFSVYYSSRYFVQSGVEVYSGPNATGTLLGSMNLIGNFQNNDCDGNEGTYCNWDRVTLPITGIARSVRLRNFFSTETLFDRISFAPAAVDAPRSPAREGAAEWSRAYPNPTRGGTVLEFSLASNAESVVRIFDLSGRLVRGRVPGTVAAGVGRWNWAGDDDRGQPVGPGLYFARLQQGATSRTLRLVVGE